MALLGGFLALTAFFLPWMDFRQTALFGNSYFQFFTGYNLVQIAGWLILEPIFALLLIDYGVIAAQIHGSLRRWVFLPSIMSIFP
jgi:hypothetical protein